MEFQHVTPSTSMSGTGTNPQSSRTCRRDSRYYRQQGAVRVEERRWGKESGGDGREEEGERKSIERRQGRRGEGRRVEGRRVEGRRVEGRRVEGRRGGGELRRISQFKFTSAQLVMRTQE